MTFTDAEKLAEIDREIAFRHRVYKWQVSKGKMTKEQAQHQIQMMIAIRLDYFEKVKAAEPAGPLFA